MPQQIPTDGHNVGDPGHTADHNNISDMLGLLTSVVAQAAGSPNLPATPPATAAVAALQGALAGQTLDDSKDFHPEAYGAKGDGLIVADGAMTSGTATLTCATSAPFLVTDVGKSILVEAAGSAAGNATLVATITGFTSASVVTLSANALATVSGSYAVYGTDDTTAINSAVQAATAYALAGPLEAVIQFLPKCYMVAGPLIQGNASWGPGNAQIPFPFRSMALPKITLTFLGIPDTTQIHFGLNTGSPVISGAALISCSTTLGTNNVTFGPASVLGGYTHQQGAGDSVFSNFRPIFQGITVVVPYNGTYAAVDCYGCIGMVIRSLACMAFARPTYMTNPTSNISAGNQWTFGLRTPTTSSDADVFIDNYAGTGFGAGLVLGEHIHASRGFCIYNVIGIQCYSTTTGSAMLHATQLCYWCCEANNVQLGILGTDTMRLKILTFDVDGGASSSPFTISDASSQIQGEVHLRGNTSTYTFNGGMAKLRVIDSDRVTGHVASPSVPATTVAYTNNVFLRDAAVTIVSGASTVSAITIDGTATGATLATGGASTTVIVPSGKTIALTYTSAPTWNWVLL